jgi:transketolase
MRETRDPRKTFGTAVTELAEKNENIVVLSADSGKSSGFGDFAKKHPDRYFEFGIMEQGVVGIASGLATTGKIPVFCAIAPFVTSRPYEMFRNDLGYMRQNVKIVGRNGGISYSDLGSTHHSLEDFAIIRMIPGVVVLSPQDPGEIISSCKAMFDYDGPVYMRIENDPIPDLFPARPFNIGKCFIAKEGSDLTLITTGPIAESALEAAAILQKENISIEVVSAPTVWPIDKNTILKSAAKTKKIVTLEEHYVIGGLGTIVSEICAEELPTPVKKLGIPHEYAVSGKYRDILRYYGLDAQGVANSVKAFI